MPRSPLITRVDDALAVGIKEAADVAGVPASVYIGRLLEEHLRAAPSNRFYKDNIGVVAVEDLQEGDVVVVDPVFGVEQVVGKTHHQVEGHGEIVKLNLRWFGTNGQASNRFVFRGKLEPCIAVTV